MPFAGEYHDEIKTDIPDEEHYVLEPQTIDGNSVFIHPSTSRQAGGFLNTSLKINKEGYTLYNKEGLPEYDMDRINCFFIDKIVTFQHTQTDKIIHYPIVLVLYVGNLY